jgi:hypothetical protein
MVDENVFLAHAFFIGIYITFVYDLLRILRRVVPHSSFWVSVEDLAFWVYCAGKVFLLMHHESDGTLRWFAVLGALVGMLLYRKTVGALFVKYMSLALIKVRDFCIKICKMVCKPFCAAGKKVTGVLGKAVKKAGPESTKKKLTLLVKMFRM